MDFNLKLILIQAPVILFALTVHEFCHAWVADMLGDDTAKRQGRLTLNPIAHLDVFGTILMFLAGFGWAKPVPVNPLNFENPRKGMLLVAIAGPISNLAMAIVAGMILKFGIIDVKGIVINPSVTGIMPTILVMVILTLQFGVALAVFNMLPLPPLDGSRVVYGLLPERQAYAYSRFEPYGIIILFGLFFFGGRVFTYVLWYPVSIITEFLSGYSYFELWSVVRHLSA
ncbi:MAG TPA: site-2 protease family protein [Thermodesulfobacteriota bacterium]|nr:site-2 protease family protein [Thermodesulfobacteriota bacterium]